jgi:hypothetical protein
MRTWDLDIESMHAAAGWSSHVPGLLADEVEQVLKAFPTFVAALGVPLSEDQATIEAAEPVLCGYCKDLVIFDRGTRCATCQRPFPCPPKTMVGLVGRIPALIAGRPFEDALPRRIETLNAEEQSLWRQSLLSVGDKAYLAPRFGIWFSRSFPHSPPPVMVWPEYFPLLDIPPDHVYDATPYYRLCLFASWREQPAVRILQNRVIPRLLIDLMVADLQAVGKLKAALEKLDTSLYELYHLVGRPEQAAPLQQVYQEFTGHGSNLAPRSR